MNERSEKLIQPALVKWTAVLVIVAVAGYLMKHTLSCFLLSFVLAYLLDPLVVSAERRGRRRSHAIAVLYAVLTVFAVFFMIFLVPVVTSRWQDLIRNLPTYLQKMKTLSGQLKQGYTPAYGAAEWQWIIDSFTGSLDSMTGKLGAGVYSAASTVAFNILNILLAPILVFFMLHYKQAVKDELIRWLPPNQKPLILQIGEEVNRSVGGYIRGQLIVSLIVALLSAVALYMLDVDYALLNGLFAGIASILPFIGVVLATIPPLFFAYVKFQTGTALLQVIGVFSVIYFVEGYLIKPLVFKEAMNLNPLVTIIFVMALGELMGFWGILLAIPIAAALKITLEHVRQGDFYRIP